MSHGDLLWEANFNDMNALKHDWNIENAHPRKNNNELQRYTEEVFKFNNSELTICTKRNGHDINSGRINTRGHVEVQYGYIEAMIKFNSGDGLWPAFWMLGNDLRWPDCGEIDIMEWVSWNADATYGTLHGPGYCGGNAYGSGGCKILNKPLSNEYHKYAIEWKPNCIKWFIDDKLFFTATENELKHKKNNSRWVYNDRKFYIILNMAVGGEFGGAKFSEHHIYDHLPEYTEFNIKYVKVYKTSDGLGSISNKQKLSTQLCNLEAESHSDSPLFKEINDKINEENNEEI